MRCTCARATAPVTATCPDPFLPIMPSAETASFRVTCGRFFTERVRYPAMACRGLSGKHAGLHLDARFPQDAHSRVRRPARRGRVAAATTRATPAVTSASAQGGVRP